VHNAWVVVTVCAGERHASGELHGTVALDFDLHAVGVELGAAGGVGEEGDVAFVQGDEFGADEVSCGESDGCHTKREFCEGRSGGEEDIW
jgi:hypothetical protein